MKTASSTLSVDFANLQGDIELVEKGGVDYVRVGVMDDRFVPNIMLGSNTVQAIQPIIRLPLGVHLIVAGPENYAPAFVKTGADITAVHVEATPHIYQALQMTKSLGAKAGVVINPGAPVSMTRHILPLANQMLAMTADLGLGGQGLIEETVEEIAKPADLRKESNWSYTIEVDGEIVPGIARVCKDVGANISVAESCIHGAENSVGRVEQLGEAPD